MNLSLVKDYSFVSRMGVYLAVLSFFFKQLCNPLQVSRINLIRSSSFNCFQGMIIFLHVHLRGFRPFSY